MQLYLQGKARRRQGWFFREIGLNMQLDETAGRQFAVGMANKRDLNFEAADVLRMFPTFVWKADLKPVVHQSLNENIIRALDQLRRDELAPGRAWQSERALHKLDEFHKLVSCINEAIERVLEHLKVSYRAFEITAFWANISMPGAEHKMHCHPNNFLSGVYYVATHEGAETINFHDPRSQTGIIRPPATELTAENADQVVVTVKNGTLSCVPSLVATLGRCQRERETENKHQFQHHVFCICRRIEQTAVVGSATRGGIPQPLQ